MRNAKTWFIHLIFGLSSGIPLLLTGSTLQVWMTEQKIDVKTIGAFALVGLPYNLKFLWSPIIDRYQLPFLTRRRAWLLSSQILLALSIVALGFSHPLESIQTTAILALLVSFMSATQDIVIDAHRRETLTVKEIGYGLSLYVTGYRIGMLIAGAFALWFADQYQVAWSKVYTVVAAFLILGILATFFADEAQGEIETPKTLKDAVINPFVDFFSQKGVWWIFAFILLYKLGDNLASAMTAPFVIQHGFTKTEYAAVVKGVGLGSTIVGGFVGAWIMARIGLNRSLWVFGFFQAIAILSFVWLSLVDKNNFVLGLAVACETFTAGMAVPAFNAFIAFLTNQKFTATQYALLTSLAAVPRTLISSPSGILAEKLGWTNYFLFCTLIAIPGMLLLFKFAPWNGRHYAEVDE